MLLLTVRLFSGWLWIRRLKTRGASPAGEALRQSACGSQSSFTCRARCASSSLRSSRCRPSIGWLKPIILLPASALGRLEPGAARGHPRARARAHPPARLPGQSAADAGRNAAVLSPGRVVGLAADPNRARELLRRPRGQPLRRSGHYAQALANLEQLRGAAGRLAVAATGGSLLHRVRRLLGAPSHAGRGPGWLAGVVAVV